MSRSGLAKAAGVDRALLTRIEQGDLSGSIDTLVAIALVLELDLNALKTLRNSDEIDAPTEPYTPTP